jgi:murein DD-endopeptidase MepM/ murein hydrolase activator NlpD
LTAEEGDKVTRGEKIAELGNTGNANASHLHFHLMDGPSVLGSNGLPYVIDRFEYAGQVAVSAFLETDDFLSGAFNEDRLAKPEPRAKQFPLLLDVVDFPASQ